jgi:phosphoserine phosphatase
LGETLPEPPPDIASMQDSRAKAENNRLGPIIQTERDAMNVYDFDNTILRGDSTARFFAWCLRNRLPMWRDVPAQAANGLLFMLRLRKKQDFKQRMLHFLTLIGDVDGAVDAFWQENLCRVKAWYPPRHREDDVVISASPEFLIRPACAKLGISCVIGSPVDKHTGHFLGPNCHGQEKVNRFRARFPGAKIDEFYSDSHSDDPLAALAQRAYLVKGERLLPW